MALAQPVGMSAPPSWLMRAPNRTSVGSGDIFPENLPPVVRDTIARLDRIIQEADDDSEKLRATRALGHLYRLLQSSDVLSGKAR